MRVKRFFYSLLLILFCLVLAVDVAVWRLTPDAKTDAETDTGFSFAPPEGMTLPEGVTLPEDMTPPKGMTRPEGSGSFPEGMTFPETEGGSEGSLRRSRRSSRDDEGSENADSRPSRPSSTGEVETAAALELPSWVPSEVQALAPYAQMIYPYRLYILIGAVLGAILCILRLIFLGKKIRQQMESQEGEGVSLRRVALWPAFLLLLGALVLVALLFPVNEEEQAEDGAVTNERVLSGQAEEKDLVSLIQSAGSLEEQEAVSLKIPASVTVASVCVKNGDLVTAGQIVAKVDQTALMKSIASVHEVLDDIDSQLQEAHEARGTTALKAPAAGTVKAVYAEAGRTAMDVMNEYGALMLLSLDGRMAVQVRSADGLTVSTPVIVTLPDGQALTGEVTHLEDGVATVTVVDRGYDVGTEVFVKTEDGALLGSGPLYVHKALHITGYLGTITRIYRQEGSTVYADTALIGLNNTADLAEYAALLRQREKYEAELQKLFEIYQDGYIHAPCAGRIEGLDETLPYASLSDMVLGLTAQHTAAGPADADSGKYVHYVGVVQGNAGGLLSLQVGADPVNVSSYSSLPGLPANLMTGIYTVPGSVPIYLLSSNVWKTIPVSDILAGDKILFTFDGNGTLVWVIVAHTAQSATPSPTPSPTPSGSANPSGAPEGTPNPSGTPGPGGGHHISFGKGAAKTTPKPTYTIATTELCTITPQERMLITVPIDELDVLSLSLGQEADLYLDALPASGLKAVVTDIDPEGVNSGGNTKYSVTLTLDRGAQLYPGMNGTVCFPRQEGKGVLTVPLAAVVEEGDRTIIYTAYDEAANQLLAPVEVQTGVSDGTDVQIVSGLSPGDTYYYRYADAISYVTADQSAQN